MQYKVKSFLKRYFFTREELLSYLSIAFPMVISQSTDTLMFFTDRVFLSYYKKDLGELYLNASLAAGVTAFFLCSIFIITSSYTNALTSQYFGAKKFENCAKAGAQSFYFGFFSYPILLLMIFIVPNIYEYFEHDPMQTTLQIQYTKVILLGSIFAIVRAGISGFFIGIGKSNIVMASNIFGLLLNIPCNYVLIHGTGIFPELGIVGAAVATIISSTASLLFQLLVYFGKKLHSQYHTRQLLQYNRGIFGKLIRYGAPQGIEGLFGVGAFNYFILVMNNFGPVVGAAVTIAINWDSMFFIPMIGAQFATTSLVGRHIGAKNLKAAIRVVSTSFLLMTVYAVIIIFCFLVFTHVFINPFMATMSNAEEVYPLASVMLKTACLYLFADAAHLTFSGVLRGAGDTKVAMYIFISITVVFAVLIYAVVENNLVTPMGAWMIFVAFAITLGIGMLIRYLQGKWKTLNIIEADEHK